MDLLVFGLFDARPLSLT